MRDRALEWLFALAPTNIVRAPASPYRSSVHTLASMHRSSTITDGDGPKQP